MTEHIITRFLLHFGATGILVPAVTLGLLWLRRRLRTSWLPAEYLPNLLLAAAAIGLLPAFREAYDVANGQPLFKAFTDNVSWVGGAALSAFLTYRNRKA